MLVPLVKRVDQVKELYQEIVLYNNKYKFWVGGQYWSYNLVIPENDDWSRIAFVSESGLKHQINGILSATCQREENKVSGLSFLSFRDSITLVEDAFWFMRYLLEDRNFNRIEFFVHIGNPAEQMYDKFVSRFNGRIIGTFHEAVRLPDNKLYDIKWYEITKKGSLSLIKKWLKEHTK